MPWAQRPGWPSTLRDRTSGAARSEPSMCSTREASRSYSIASSLEMPMCRSVLCAWVNASAKVRAVALGSWYFCAIASAASRLEATPVANEIRTKPPGSKANALAQADDRIEHGAGGAGQRAPVERHWVLGTASAAEEPQPVGLPFDGALHPPLDAQHVHCPHPGLVRRARAPRAHQRRALREVLRFDEQLPERRMGQVVGQGRERDLAVARDLQFAGTIAQVRDREPPHLDVVLRGDGDVEPRRDAVVLPAEHGALGVERDEVLLRLPRRRVIGGRPHRAVAHIADIQELAAEVARGVLAVARHGAAATEAGAASGVGDDGDVRAVRQELGVRIAGVRRPEAPHGNGRNRGRDARCLGRARLSDRGMARHPFLQEEGGCLHPWIGVKATHHHVIEQGIRECHQGHSLMMGQEGSHDGAPWRRPGIVDGTLSPSSAAWWV